MNNMRTEHDSMGEVLVPADKYWGAQTERSRNNFQIGVGLENMPGEIISAFATLKKAAAMANRELIPDRMTAEKCDIISQVCDEISEGKLDGNFPLVVWQTGSGTQTNMNVNEVIAGRGNELLNKKLLHPNDDVNMSQSSNDTFPSASSIAGAIIIKNRLIPALSELANELKRLEEKNTHIIKVGRTHLQDAVPIRLSQEISGWRTSLENDIAMLTDSVKALSKLALGGTAVGTGLNCPKGFDKLVAKIISDETGIEFVTDENKFRALTSKSAFVTAHGCIKAAACDMMKIANDIRFLSSGPRAGYGELNIPENEPGSSIMPGKVNPTQCEAVTMVAVQIMGNDTAVSIAASQGNFELNVYCPVLIYNFLQSARLLSDAAISFTKNCVVGITPNESVIRNYLDSSLMTVTALNPYIGYEKSAEIAKKAHKEGLTLKESALMLGYLTEDEFDKIIQPEKMT